MNSYVYRLTSRHSYVEDYWRTKETAETTCYGYDDSRENEYANKDEDEDQQKTEKDDEGEGIGGWKTVISAPLLS